MTHQALKCNTDWRDRPANDPEDGDLDELVRKIFDIIPSYYDEDEALRIRILISEYTARKLRQRK